MLNIFGISDIFSIGGDLSVDLEWTQDDECCSTLSGRYPATSYNIYFDTGEEPVNVEEDKQPPSLSYPQ